MRRFIPNSMNMRGRKDEMAASNAYRPSIISLAELIDKYAHQWYKDNEKDTMKGRWGHTYNWKELDKEIDWRSLKVHHASTRYDDIDKPSTPNNHILFRSTFINDTDQEQQYNLKAERRTTSTCSFSILEGFTTEQAGSAELEVPLPACVVEGSSGFRREYSLEQSQDKKIEEELVWSIESNIKIPSLSQTKAELIVRENHYHGKFEIKTYFYGEIRVKLFKDSQELMTMEFADLPAIFTRDQGFQEDSNGLFRITRGECRARFSVSQCVELHATPLFPNNYSKRINETEI